MSVVMFLWMLCKLPYTLLKKIFSRQFYYIVPEPFLIAGTLMLWKNIDILIFKYHPYLWLIFFYYMLGFTAYFIDVYIQLRQRKHDEDRKFGGYLRWDGVFEVHIGDVNSEREFYNKLIMAIVYCKEKGVPLEFIAANRSYGRCIKSYGEAILIIKQLGWYTRMILTQGMGEKTIVNQSQYPILLRLDPDKINIRKLKNGNYILR